jgi:hypothetical protein
MMRRYIGYIGLALALLVPAAAKTQQVFIDQRTLPLAVAWDVNGEAADDNQIVTSSTITDSNSYDIAAQPDTCRLVDITFTDADSSITAGTFTVVGTDCYGDALTATYEASSPINGVQTLTVGTPSTAESSNLASAAYFGSVTSVSNGAITGESGAADTIEVGYSGTGAFWQYPAYGILQYNRGSIPFRYVALDEWKKSNPNTVITASGTTLTATNAGFTGLAVNDIIRFNLLGNHYSAKITTYTSTTEIIISKTLLFPTEGTKGFEYQKFYVSADPQDGWFRVDGWDAAMVLYDVDTLTASTGLDSIVQCVTGDVDDDAAVTVDTDTVLTAATGNAVTSIDLRLAPAYSRCRVGVNFDSTDSIGGDTAGTDDVNIYLGLRR